MIRETVESLAAMVGGVVHGDASRAITGVGDLRLAGPEQIGFVRSSRYAGFARGTGAGALLVAQPIDGCAAAQIVVSNVDASFARIAGHFHPERRAEEHAVHPAAVVAEDAVLERPVVVEAGAVVGARARIGAGTRIGANSVVGERATVGRDCVLHARVVLYPGVRLGDRCILHSGAVVGSDGFGYVPDDDGRYVKIPQLGSVTIGDDVEIGANTAIDRGAIGDTKIGRGTKIDNLVHVGHNCEFGENVAVAGFSAFSGTTRLGDGVVCAGHTVTAGHLSVVSGARIGGNSVVHGDVREADDYMGYPLMRKGDWFRTLGAIRKLLSARRGKPSH